MFYAILNRKLEMNKFKFLILTVIIAALTSCQLDIEPGTPNCIKTKIKAFSKSEVLCASGKSVNKYSFQDRIVFVFDPGTCGADMAADVYDSECNYLGFLGGIAGNSEINGEEFSIAVFKGVVWKN